MSHHSQSFHDFYIKLGAKFPEPKLNEMSLDILGGISEFMLEFKSPVYIGEQHFIAAFKSEKHFSYMVLDTDYRFHYLSVINDKSPLVAELRELLPHEKKLMNVLCVLSL